jgi:hypothetical protein
MTAPLRTPDTPKAEAFHVINGVRLPDDTWQAIRAYAKAEGIEPRVALAEAARKYMGLE